METKIKNRRGYAKVYFIKVSQDDRPDAVIDKLKRLLQESKAFNFVAAEDCVAVKLHFGEEGNTGFVRPQYLKAICDALKAKGGRPFLSDTNTLYRSRRANSPDHLKLAKEHGFSRKTIGAEIIIPDDQDPANAASVEINSKFFKNVSVAKVFLDASALVGVAHFKGHMMTGFGGALKNIGMGVATRRGKLSQHSDLSPVIHQENCLGCRACEKVCPVKAIAMIKKKAVIGAAKCIGCASCIAACKYAAIDVNWDSGAGLIQEKMIDHAFAVLKGKKNKSAFINFATKITKECDCLAKDDPRVCPDIGIFFSTDPVSVDKACRDAVIKRCGKDIFKQLHPETDGFKQLDYASRLGLGSLEYDLIRVAG